MILWLVALPAFQTISIVTVMCLVVPPNACTIILGSLEASLISWRAQWSLEYKIWNDRISMHTRRCWQQSVWYWWLLSLSAAMVLVTTVLICWGFWIFEVLTLY